MVAWKVNINKSSIVIFIIERNPPSPPPQKKKKKNLTIAVTKACYLFEDVFSTFDTIDIL